MEMFTEETPQACLQTLRDANNDMDQAACITLASSAVAEKPMGGSAELDPAQASTGSLTKVMETPSETTIEERQWASQHDVANDVGTAAAMLVSAPDRLQTIMDTSGRTQKECQQALRSSNDDIDAVVAMPQSEVRATNMLQENGGVELPPIRRNSRARTGIDGHVVAPGSARGTRAGHVTASEAEAPPTNSEAGASPTNNGAAATTSTPPAPAAEQSPNPMNTTTPAAAAGVAETTTPTSTSPEPMARVETKSSGASAGAQPAIDTTSTSEDHSSGGQAPAISATSVYISNSQQEGGMSLEMDTAAGTAEEQLRRRRAAAAAEMPATNTKNATWPSIDASMKASGDTACGSGLNQDERADIMVYMSTTSTGDSTEERIRRGRAAAAAEMSAVNARNTAEPSIDASMETSGDATPGAVTDAPMDMTERRTTKEEEDSGEGHGTASQPQQ